MKFGTLNGNRGAAPVAARPSLTGNFTLRRFQLLPRALRRHKLLRLMALSLRQNVWLVRVNDSFDAYIDLRDGFARLIAIEDEFEPDFFALAGRILPQAHPVFLDVGANYGLMAIGIKKSINESAECHLFEPNIHLCKLIRRSIEFNKLERVHLSNRAVMDCEAEMRLKYCITHSGAGYVGVSNEGVPVKAMTLDGYIEANKIAHVDLLKIDVEGNEAAVLEGAKGALEKRNVSAVYFEYCPEQIARVGSGRDPLEVLQGHNYEVFCLASAKSEAADTSTHFLERSEGGPIRAVPLWEWTPARSVRITNLLAVPAGAAQSRG